MTGIVKEGLMHRKEVLQETKKILLANSIGSIAIGGWLTLLLPLPLVILVGSGILFIHMILVMKASGTRAQDDSPLLVRISARLAIALASFFLFGCGVIFQRISM
jgi:hypothetical protein